MLELELTGNPLGERRGFMKNSSEIDITQGGEQMRHFCKLFVRKGEEGILANNGSVLIFEL